MQARTQVRTRAHARTTRVRTDREIEMSFKWRQIAPVSNKFVQQKCQSKYYFLFNCPNNGTFYH